MPLSMELIYFSKDVGIDRSRPVGNQRAARGVSLFLSMFNFSTLWLTWNLQGSFGLGRPPQVRKHLFSCPWVRPYGLIGSTWTCARDISGSNPCWSMRVDQVWKGDQDSAGTTTTNPLLSLALSASLPTCFAMLLCPPQPIPPSPTSLWPHSWPYMNWWASIVCCCMDSTTSCFWSIQVMLSGWIMLCTMQAEHMIHPHNMHLGLDP